MTHATINIIYAEHGNLLAMLRSISLLLSEHRRRGTLPDFSVLRAMVFYVDEFVERQHHTKGPVAERVLSASERATPDATFMKNRDPADPAGAERRVPPNVYEDIEDAAGSDRSWGSSRSPGDVAPASAPMSDRSARLDARRCPASGRMQR